MEPRHPLLDTVSDMLRRQTPNLLRLYHNPAVVETCYVLSRYVRTTWGQTQGDWQSFLANCFDEALSGAIKLARYSASVAGKPAAGLVVDPTDRLGPFAECKIAAGRVEFLPGLSVVGPGEEMPMAAGPFGLLALVAGRELERHAAAIRTVIERDRPIVIVCVNRTSLTELRRGAGWLGGVTPDIVVFDESFVDCAVPFSAFSAGKPLFDHWNRPGKTTFHSTTYQPNSISTMHFLRCLAAADAPPPRPAAGEGMGVRGDLFRRLYNPSLDRMIRTAGFGHADIQAAGSFVTVKGRKIFDAVSGVACSVRGHNPASYADEIAAMGLPADCEAELASRLRDLTGLECMVPATSGATAVENALKLALAAQFPRRHVLALKAGFGGKTLLALTGTAHPAYKDRIDPLYPDVLYADPFAPDAVEKIDALLRQYPVAVVQTELIQAVGGVRPIPEKILRFLDESRQRHGHLLLIDEVQTGMCRTGPFTLSRALGFRPDLLLLGKATSDMIFPYALTLYSQAVQARLDAARSDLPAVLRRRHGYEFGYKTVLNVLRLFDALNMPRRVQEAGDLFARLLQDGLAGCGNVREVRAHGLLIGIELDATRWPLSWFGKKLSSLYLFGMLQQRDFPVLVGFCQYEPNVLKITPALNVSADQVRSACATIVEVLKRPLPGLVATAVGGMMGSFKYWRSSHEHRKSQTDDALVG